MRAAKTCSYQNMVIFKKKNNQIHTARKPITKILQTFKFCPPKVVLKAKDNNAIEDSVTVQLRIG